MKKQKAFARFATWFGDIFGSPGSFVLSLVIIFLWGVLLGPLMHYSDTWQLAINTPTTIIELFAAITIQYVGNRIQRQQQEHEEKMLKILEHIESIAEKLEVSNPKKPRVPPADF